MCTSRHRVSTITTSQARPACDFLSKKHNTAKILDIFGLAIDRGTGCLLQEKPSQFKLLVDVVFIRHSTTVFNENKIVQGRFCPDHEGRPRDPGLSQKGREAARMNAAVIQEKYPNIQIVVTSPQARAKETADILFSGMRVQRVTAEPFSELHAGRLEGVLKDDQDPTDVSLYHDKRNAVHKIGQTGESAIEKLSILGNALIEINQRYGGQSCPLGVVTHSNTIGLLKVLLGIAESKEIGGVMAYRLRNLQTANNEDLFFKRSPPTP